MTKRSRPCVFCGQYGLSREHLWPAWAAKLLPTSSHNNATGQPLTGDAFVAPRELLSVQQGSPKTLTIKAVCRACNNGWMSRLETLAKPVVTRLIEGDPTDFSAADCQVLGRWIFTKMACVDRMRHVEAVFDLPAMTAFLATFTMPPNFKTWLYRNSDAAWASSLRVLTFVTVQGDPESIPFKCNSRAVLWGLGATTVFSIWDPIPGGSVSMNDDVPQVTPGPAEFRLPTRGLSPGDHKTIADIVIGNVRPRPDLPPRPFQLL